MNGGRREGAGRPTTYNKEVHPVLAAFFARHGFTDDMIAEKLEIGRATLSRWKNKYPEFKEALAINKLVVDKQVEDSLLKRALGYEYDEVEVIASQSNGKNKKEQPTKIRKIRKVVPPDVNACMFWLKIRLKNVWNEVQKTEITGKNGGPIQVDNVNKNLDLSDFTDEELQLAEKIGLAIQQRRGAVETDGVEADEIS